MGSEYSYERGDLDHHSEDFKKIRSKYLVFTLDTKRYGIPLSSVKEVIGMTEFTPVPDRPRFFKGLINLRGKIHSVIDLRTKLALSEIEYQEKKTSIIITEIGGGVVGSIVDDVIEVANFEHDQIEESLSISHNTGKDEYILGVAKTKDQALTLLLDVTKILSDEELGFLRQKEAA